MKNSPSTSQIEEARIAAIKVLKHNAHGDFEGLPRTAGTGYPEPYTRDLMIAMLGVASTGDPQLISGMAGHSGSPSTEPKPTWPHLLASPRPLQPWSQ